VPVQNYIEDTNTRKKQSSLTDSKCLPADIRIEENTNRLKLIFLPKKLINQHPPAAYSRKAL
jgi:hypothetical protein